MPMLTTVEALCHVRVRYRGEVLELRPGQRLTLPEDKAAKLLDQIPTKVRVLPAPVLFVVDEQGPCATFDTATREYTCRRHPAPLALAPTRNAVVVEPGSGRVHHWEGADGVMRSGTAAWLGRGSAADGTEEFWVLMESRDGASWVRDTQLRSKAPDEARG